MWLYLIESGAAHGYDCNRGFVVLAATEAEARSLACNWAADEGEIWADAELATCKQIGTADSWLGSKPLVLLRDFAAG